jgi:hypothetical protein
MKKIHRYTDFRLDSNSKTFGERTMWPFDNQKALKIMRNIISFAKMHVGDSELSLDGPWARKTLTSGYFTVGMQLQRGSRWTEETLIIFKHPEEEPAPWDVGVIWESDTCRLFDIGTSFIPMVSIDANVAQSELMDDICPLEVPYYWERTVVPELEKAWSAILREAFRTGHPDEPKMVYSLDL